MGHIIVVEVATITDDENDIYEPIPYKTGMNHIWLSLLAVPRNPSAAEII